MYAVLPKGSKPSRTASKDQTRPVLTTGELRQLTDESWELVTTNSYALARVPLSIKDGGPDEPLTAGPISGEALKAIEKAGAFHANGSIVPLNEFGVVVGPTFAREIVGTFPDVDQLMPDLTGQEFSIGLDAKLLFELAQSLGAKGRRRRGDGHQPAEVKLTFTAGQDGAPNPLRPVTVEPLGGEGRGLCVSIRIPS